MSVLKMRWLLLLLVLAVGIAQSQEKTPPKQRGDRAAQKSAPKRIGTDERPLVITVNPTVADKIEAERREEERKEKADSDRNLVRWTSVLAGLALLQFLALVGHAIIFRSQAKSLRETIGEMQKATAATEKSADAARESADALVSTSMPVLFPTVVNMAGLHPLIPIATPYTHDSNIFIMFENFGGTPATIREVRAKLYLTLRDVPPAPNPFDWPILPYPVMIPGNSRAADQHFGALDMKQTIAYGPSEISELHAEADPNGIYRRFILMGRVTYDDFFGWRHTRTFCVKLRAWVANENGPLNQFQVGMGGSAYNKWTKEKTPNPDPLEDSQS